MAIFEKIFQRNDKAFVQLYFLTLGLSLYISSMIAFYLLDQEFILTEHYATASIFIMIIFWVSSLLKLKELRYIIGTVQFLRNELVLLIQTFFVAILLASLFKMTADYSRIWFVSTFILSFFILIFIKAFFDQIYTYLITSNIIQRNILLVGDTSNCQHIINKFPKKKSNSVIKCLIATDDKGQNSHFYGVPKVNLTDDLGYVLKHHLIGQVWIVSSVKTQIHIEQLVEKFLNFSVDCRLISPESKFKFTVGLDSEAGFDFYNISISPFHGTSLFVKYVLDKIFALFFIILTSPLVIIASASILIEDGFPILFKQKRTGWDGKSFFIYKLRTIYNSGNTPKTQQVEAGDPRITEVGKIIRRFSIDELPQFFNVLIGNMSTVGPRPHMVEHTEFYSEEILNFMQRHKCPPGLTGWAQINGFRGPTKNKERMNRRFQYDLYYIKNWSTVLDLYIMVRTVLVILFQKVD